MVLLEQGEAVREGVVGVEVSQVRQEGGEVPVEEAVLGQKMEGLLLRKLGMEGVQKREGTGMLGMLD